MHLHDVRRTGLVILTTLAQDPILQAARRDNDAVLFCIFCKEALLLLRPGAGRLGYRDFIGRRNLRFKVCRS